jgi:hypothetical protein
LVMTPFEKLTTVVEVQRFLRCEITLAALRRQAASMSDNEAASRLNAARTQLFLSIHKRSRNAA